jgi:hypothetical protein
MDFHQPGLKEMQDRIGELEKQNRRIKRIGVVSLVVLASLVLMGQATLNRSVTAETVTASEFVLRNSFGEMQAHLFVEKNGTAVFEFTKGHLAMLMMRRDGDQGYTQIMPGGIVMTNPDAQHETGESLQDAVIAPISPNYVETVTIGGKSRSFVNQDIARFPTTGLVLSAEGLQVGRDGNRAFVVPRKVALRDREGFSGELGHVALSTTSGETIETPEISMVLFGKDGRILFVAPSKQ